MPKQYSKLIFKPNEEVSEPFQLNGLHQILCKMPPGETWGDIGDRIVTLEAKDPGPPIITNHAANIAAGNSAYLEGNSVYTVTGDASLISILTSTGGELKFSVDEDLPEGLAIDFGRLGNLLNPVEVKNNLDTAWDLPQTLLRLGQVYHSGRHIGDWIRQTNQNEGVVFEEEVTTTSLADLGPYDFSFRDQYYSGINEISLPSGTLAIAPNSNSDRASLNFELRTNISGFTINIIPANNFSFRNNDANNAVSSVLTAFPVLVNGVEVADLYTGVRPVILSANGQASLAVDDDDFVLYTYTGDLTPSDVISLGMRGGLDDDIDIDLDGSTLRITLHRSTQAVAIDTEQEFTIPETDLQINQIIEVPRIVSGDEISILFRMQGFDQDDVSFQFGRALDIALSGQTQSEDDWFEVEDPVTRATVIYWNGPGFQEVEGSAEMQYRLRTTNMGCRATKHPIRRWVSSRPGR